MEYRQLGRAGVRVSVIGLGTNRFGTEKLPQEEVNKILDTANELAQAWLLAQPQVCSVISGATSLEHVLHNVTAVSWNLTQTELAEINALLEPSSPHK